MAKVWPFLAQKSSAETYSWRTDVRRAFQGEIRESLRTARRLLRYEHLLTDEQNNLAQALVRSNLNGLWEVPLWSEVSKGTGTIGNNTVECNTNADYVSGGKVFIMSRTKEYETVEISSVGDGSLTLSDNLTVEPYMVAPVIEAQMTDAFDGLRVQHNVWERSSSFTSTVDTDPSENPYTEFQDIPVLEDPPSTVFPLENRISQVRQFIDNGMGPIQIETVRDDLDEIYEFSFVDIKLEDRWKRKKFYHYLRGRDKPFWLPTWTEDLELLSEIQDNDTFILVNSPYYSAEELVGKSIKIDSGETFYREIISAQEEEENEDITLEIEPLGSYVESATISFIDKVRLDTDEIDFLFVGQTLQSSALLIGVRD